MKLSAFCLFEKLIRKKRGLGAGKINGPGGKIESGETPLECAIRETHEELRITAHGATECGQLSFQFADGLSLFCHVFRADSYSGTPQETDEAAPLWTDWAKMPYHEMWADDELWFPLLIERRNFKGYFTFDADVMTSHRVEVLEFQHGKE